MHGRPCFDQPLLFKQTIFDFRDQFRRRSRDQGYFPLNLVPCLLHRSQQPLVSITNGLTQLFLCSITIALGLGQMSQILIQHSIFDVPDNRLPSQVGLSLLFQPTQIVVISRQENQTILLNSRLLTTL